MAAKRSPKPRALPAADAPAGRRRAATKAPRAASASSPIDAYLARIEHAAARATLTQLCAQLRELLPQATETISYQMPAFRLPSGKVAAGFAFHGKNCGYYPHSGAVIEQLGAQLGEYRTTKGAIRFPPDAPLPKKVVSALVRARVAELAEQERAPKAAKPAAKAASKPSAKRASSAGPAAAGAPTRPRIFAMPFATVYPLYVQKAEKKGRTRAEVDEVIAWLTGYRGKSLQRAIDARIDFQAFFAGAPRYNPNAGLITGVVCGVRVENVEDPLMQKIRYLDKLVDELAKGKKLESILRG